MPAVPTVTLTSPAIVALSSGVSMLRATVCMVLMLLCIRANANIVATGGAVMEVAPPADIRTGEKESNTAIIAFIERSGVAPLFKSPSELQLNINLSGTYPSGGKVNLTPAKLPGGALVESYFVHFDCLGNPSGGSSVFTEGWITFSTYVVGIVANAASLLESHEIIGLSTVAYPTGNHQGIEFGDDGAYVTLSQDRRTVSFGMPVGQYADNLRIITATPYLIPGDANLNGIVDGADYTLWADNYFATGRSWLQGDFNNDQKVDGADYTWWADNFAPTPPSAPAVLATAVPEPSTWALAMGPLTAGWWWRNRRHRKPRL
jgi:hypothetical protein